MNTLVEFTTFIKGIEYLIAIAFILGFIVFWQILHHQRKGLIISIIPVAILSLSLVAVASSCALAGFSTGTAQVAMETSLLSSPVLVEMYGPASFDHETHQSINGDCTGCHHNSKYRKPSCRECHGEPFDPDNLNRPGIARIFHLRCISCHMENDSGPTECIGCHHKASIPPLSVSHPLTGQGNCLTCHDSGINDIPAVPADHHNGVTNGVCELCHQSVVDESLLATGVQPHPTTGRESCLVCHGEGIGGATKVTANHVGRSNDTCSVCHQSP